MRNTYTASKNIVKNIVTILISNSNIVSLSVTVMINNCDDFDNMNNEQ